MSCLSVHDSLVMFLSVRTYVVYIFACLRKVQFLGHKACVNATCFYRCCSSMVCLLGTRVHFAKMAELFVGRFGSLTNVGSKNRVLDGVQVSLLEGALMKGVSATFCHITLTLQHFLVHVRQ